MLPESNTAPAPGQGPDPRAAVFSIYRVDTVPGGQVTTGRLRPGLEPDSPAVRELTERRGTTASTREGPHGWELLLFEAAPRPERWWLHALLFLFTLFSTTVAGSLLAGLWPIQFEMVPTLDGWWLPLPVSLDLADLWAGVPFGLSLVVVLALHEAGHYVAARRRRIGVTPPFFIPFPPYVSIIGTLGAFIRLRSPVLSRRDLLDVAVAGPLASFAASLPMLWWGLSHSAVIVEPSAAPTPYAIAFAGTEQFWLGGSLAMSAISHFALGLPAPDHVVILHPLAFAGWLGLFVTALNLLPIAQLDGGHILYAALGSRQTPLAWLFFLALLPLGFLWAGWWIWAALVFVIGRGRVKHPPLFDSKRGLRVGRSALALLAVVIFALCFIPAPFRL